jgi:hypothetical protein
VRDYDDRIRNRADFDHQIHASRVARGVRRQGELVRLPIPKHRALVPVSKVKRAKQRRVQP